MTGGVEREQRYSVTDRKSKARGCRNELLARGIILKRPFADGTNEDRQETRIDDALVDSAKIERGLVCGSRVVGHKTSSQFARAYWMVEPPPVPAASSISANATSTSARPFKSRASSNACFSSGP